MKIDYGTLEPLGDDRYGWQTQFGFVEVILPKKGYCQAKADVDDVTGQVKSLKLEVNGVVYAEIFNRNYQEINT